MGRRQRFLIWMAVLTAVWLFANWPRDGGSLKRFLQWAGCPWTFAFWHHGRLEWFDPGALAADVAVGVAVVASVAQRRTIEQLCLLLRELHKLT